jgi:ABC-type amino acid transport system permease subunit
VKFAQDNGISTKFLEEQHRLWQQPACDIAAEHENPCVLPPVKTELEPTEFADQVKVLETWLSGYTGSDMSLPMFTTVQAWSLLKNGIENTFIILVGAIAATLLFTLGFGWLLCARSATARWPARLAVVLLQSSPLVLSLVIAIGVSNAVAPFSAVSAMVSAMIVLGLTNGANAGQAISESMATLRLERRSAPQSPMFFLAVGRARKQIELFVISASKGTPVASFIGAPELVNSLTDISSFSSARLTTYLFMIVFYVAVVTAVTQLSEWTGNQLSRRFSRSWA